jgi:hypothetical protein
MVMDGEKDDHASIYLMLILFHSAFNKVKLEMEGGNLYEVARAKETLMRNTKEVQQQGIDEGKIVKTILRGGLAARERRG